MQSLRYSALALSLALAAFSTGCDFGPKMAGVTGTVTLDGNPAAGLQIEFHPKEAGQGTTAMGFTDTKGAYKLGYPGGKTGAPVGEYRVSITPSDLALMGDVTEKPDENKAKTSIPACYNSKTTLRVEVTPGENTANFDLKSAGE